MRTADDRASSYLDKNIDGYADQKIDLCLRVLRQLPRPAGRDFLVRHLPPRIGATESILS